MIKSLQCLCLFLLGFLCFAAQDQQVFISEIHYNNASTDVGEAIEIAGPAGNRPDWMVDRIVQRCKRQLLQYARSFRNDS